MSLTQCSKSLIASLIEVLLYGARSGHIEQSERLLSALHIMRPNFFELFSYDAWVLICRRDHAGAVRILRDLEQRPLRGAFVSYVKALLAVALFCLEDPQWKLYANEVIHRNDDHDSIDLVMTLMGKEQVLAATAPEAQIDRSEMQKLMQRHHLRV